MAQNPDQMGKLGVQACIKALNGEDLGGEVTDTVYLYSQKNLLQKMVLKKKQKKQLMQMTLKKKQKKQLNNYQS